jgi:hypothetical protein
MLRKCFGDQGLCAAAMPAPIGAELEQYGPGSASTSMRFGSSSTRVF